MSEEYPPPFTEFAKIARYSRRCTITEKLDGTNASVFVPLDDTLPLLAGSRSRWVPSGETHFGFEKWVERNADVLRVQLGPGLHYGEWWGPGVGKRKYPIPEKRFSLFNTYRWRESLATGALTICDVVPVIYEGLFTSTAVDDAITSLRESGSFAVPGFMNPEGIVIFHQAGNVLFKKTLEHDEVSKGSKEIA